MQESINREHNLKLCIITAACVGMALLVPGAFTLRLLARINAEHPLPQCQRHETLTYQECLDQLLFRAMAFTYSGASLLLLIGLAQIISCICRRNANAGEHDVALVERRRSYGTV